MPKKRSVDAALVDSVASNLFEALPVFPKRLLQIDTVAHELHMPTSHVQILIILTKGDLSVGELSSRLGIAKPNITPLVDALRDRGFVERIRDTQDRRIVNVHLLEAGREKLSGVHEVMAAQATAWAERISRSELKEFNNALASILRILDHVADEA